MGVSDQVVANVGGFVATVHRAADAVVALDGGSGLASAGDAELRTVAEQTVVTFAIGNASGARAAVDAAAAAVGDRPTIAGTAARRRTALVRRLDAHPPAAGRGARLTVAGRTAALEAGAELAVVAGGVIGQVVANVAGFVATVQRAANAVVALEGGSGLASAGDT